MNTLNLQDRRPTCICARLCVRMATVALIAAAFALPSAPVLAAEPAAAAPESSAATEESDPAVEQSRALFEQGLAAYEDEDYEGASRHWTEAHELMAQTPELSASRRVLGFDLAQAQMRAYARDHHRSRLVAAKPLLEGFLAWVDRPGHTMDEGEKQDRARAVELLARIERESTPAPVVPTPELKEAPAAPAPPANEPKPNGTGLLIGGGVALGAGLASIAAVVAARNAGRRAEQDYENALQQVSEAEFGTTDRERAEADVEQADRDGRRSNIALLTFATSSLLLSTAGIAMLAIGGGRRRHHVSASAALTPRSAAATLRVRF